MTDETSHAPRARARAGATLTSSLALAALLIGACASEAAPGTRTDATSQHLLSSAAAGRALAGQEVDAATLGANYGNGDAPVRIVEMSDFGCEFCRKFHMETWATLRQEFVETGKVEWKFVPFVSGQFRNSPVVSEGAECGLEQSQAVFTKMSDRLFGEQDAWARSGDPESVVRGFAEAAGADMDAWNACMSEDRRAGRVQAAIALAKQLGVRGTPTFFVVGYPPLQGALPTETFRQVLELVYQDATKGGGGGS